MVFIYITSSCHDSLRQMILYPTMHDKVMGQTRTGFSETYAQSLRVNCDLDLCPSNMILVRDTTSCHDDHLC